jgi:hypothetical protein
MDGDGKPLVPPAQFALVCAGVYRSSLPLPVHLPYLNTLGLRLVVFLSPESPNQALRQLTSSGAPRLAHLGLAAWHGGESWRPLNDDLMKCALELILDARANSPTLLVCASGLHESGAVVACLRRMQRWNMSAIFAEYRRFAGTKARLSNEHFAELFDLDLVTLPPLADRPAWLVRRRTECCKIPHAERLVCLKLCCSMARRSNKTNGRPRSDVS